MWFVAAVLAAVAVPSILESCPALNQQAMEDVSDQRVALVVVLFLHPGKHDEFEAFEGRVTPLMARYGGSVERRIRLRHVEDPSCPDEVHLVTFPDDESIRQYQQDPSVRDLAELRASIVRETVIWKGDLEVPWQSADPRVTLIRR